MQNKKLKRQFYITLFVAVLFTVNLAKQYIDTGEFPISSLIFTIIVYIALILSAITLKNNKNQ